MRLINTKIQKIYVFHMNIQSIVKNFEKFLAYQYDLLKKLDIICLTDTRVIEVLSNFEINEYSVYYNEVKINQNDGTLLYTKNKMCHTSQILDEKFKY